MPARILNTYSRFAIPAFTPTLLNLCFIVFALWLAPYFDPARAGAGLGGVRWAGCCSSASSCPTWPDSKLLPRPRLNLHDPGVWRVLTLMGPAIFGVSIGQISLLINGIFASFLVTGSVSWLYYADRLMEFPTGVLGVALGTILLPSLSRSFAERSAEEYSRLLDWGLRLTLLLALPAALGLAILATPLIATLFHHGAFDDHDVTMTSQALTAYSVGLVGLIVVKVLAPGFYARQNIRTPVKIGVRHAGRHPAHEPRPSSTRCGMPGWRWRSGWAPASTPGCCTASCASMASIQPQPGWAQVRVRVGAALVTMGLVLWFAMGSVESWLAGGLARALRLLVVRSGRQLFRRWGCGVRPGDFVKRGCPAVLDAADGCSGYRSDFVKRGSGPRSPLENVQSIAECFGSRVG